MKNFSFNSPALQFFFVKNAIFFIIFVGKTFVYQNIYGFTPVKKMNYQIGNKIEQKLGLYFSKLLKSLMLWIATFCNVCIYMVIVLLPQSTGPNIIGTS